MPTEQQLRLVTTFFPEQRFALLGDTAEGRWQTIEEFFAPYMARRGAFSHDWPLIGRADELAALLGKLGEDQIQVVLLTGTGGGGKSRIIKEAVERYQAEHGIGCPLSFANARGDRESLEELGEGEKLLIVDDAHDQGDLPILFQYVAAPENNARLVLSLRPYGRDYGIKISGCQFCPCRRGGWLRSHCRRSAWRKRRNSPRQALARFSGPIGEAETIARLTLDCSLATVIGAQVVATDHRHFEMVKNEEVFPIPHFAWKVSDIIAGRIGTKSDVDLVRKVLRVLALVQPFYPEDQTILQIVATVEGGI